MHGATPLERGPAADDEGEVVRPELGVARGRVPVRVPRARQDGATLDARPESLLAQRQPLELVQAVALRGAVDECVLEQQLAAAGVVDGR